MSYVPIPPFPAPPAPGEFRQGPGPKTQGPQVQHEQQARGRNVGVYLAMLPVPVPRPPPRAPAASRSTAAALGPFYPPTDDHESRLGAVVEGLRRETDRVHDEVRALRRDLRRAVTELRDAVADAYDSASDDEDDGDEGDWFWSGGRIRHASNIAPADTRAEEATAAGGREAPESARLHDSFVYSELSAEAKHGIRAIDLLRGVEATTLPFPQGLAVFFLQTEVHGALVRQGCGAALTRCETLPSLLLTLALRHVVRPGLFAGPELTSAQRDLVRRIRAHVDRTLHAAAEPEAGAAGEKDGDDRTPATANHRHALAVLRAIDPDQLPGFFAAIVRDMQGLLQADDPAQYYTDYVRDAEDAAWRPDDRPEKYVAVQEPSAAPCSEFGGWDVPAGAADSSDGTSSRAQPDVASDGKTSSEPKLRPQAEFPAVEDVAEYGGHQAR